MSTAVISNRLDPTKGIDMYFYNIRTMMIFEYEIKWQLGDRAWKPYSIPWMDADLYLTLGKDNVRTEVHGCSPRITKSNFNLKKVLNIGTAYHRVRTIGRFCDIGLDINDLQILFNDEIWDHIPDVELYEFDFEEWIANVSNRFYLKSLQILTPEIMESFFKSSYDYKMMKDDIGMIQNTMRNIIEL